jgi:predicted MFS family arabinose efflux permease
MSRLDIRHTNTPDAREDVADMDEISVLRPSLILLCAAAAGISAGSIYFSQPVLGILGASFSASTRVVGFIPMLTQLGYALGILLLAPLGDRFDRRRVIAIKAAVLVSALLLSAIAPSIDLLLVASFATGVSATVAQDVVPAAAALAPHRSRGKVVGTVMTGLLLGILLSRVVSGVFAEHFGWRAMFFLAAGAVVVVITALWFNLPRFEPQTCLPYAELIGSLADLWRKHGSLRRAAVSQGLLSVSFSAFWSTLAVMLHAAPFHLGSDAAGMFGLAGAAGSLAAPVAGRLADRRGSEIVTRVGSAIVMASFAIMILGSRLPPHEQLIILAVCTAGFDLGIQATLIAHQTIVYGIDPGARSRLNAVLFVGTFLGMAIGAGVGSAVFDRWGWSAVTILATLLALAALGMRLWPTADESFGG